MPVVVDHASAIPPFEQLRLGIVALVRDGQLPAGSKIPTVRTLAMSLRLAPNTVARAYRELEQQGVIETQGRRGSFIASTGDPTRDSAGRAATEYVAAIRKLGLSDDDAVQFVRSAIRA
ncbi:GntR family transcriptional regulator [Skermania sp. ID1734]|uniref:GntR family transcriptional regulator n=1 Tax=Skermania sp. ID1734 TaxID=2597516 RepID=UPI00117CCDBE|nr:GntR family transcriptional regulator [Skermania sp. ID1734]TSD99845.1 GntR family transcriptional regulator [Skermania sp. ID1734]